MATSRQFGKGPWNRVSLNLQAPSETVDAQGRRYRIYTRKIDNYPGWSIHYLKSLASIQQHLSDPLIRITGHLILSLCLLIGISVFLLYRKASREITKRKTAETKLRKSEERYRSLYHHTPAMLHSIDSKGNLVSVSDYWTEALGYSREEMIGKKFTAIMTKDSRGHAEKTVFPEFFQTGICKNISYQYIRKDGRIIDILLSATGDRDADNRIARSLAISMDVTEQKRAESALKQAQEELNRYTRNLEQLVRKRTGEITSFIKYTPAVIYILKNAGNRYSLVNNRFEELFGVRTEMVRGQTHHDILPGQIADQFRRHDRRVLKEKRSCQVNEQIPQADGIHTYLAVKFPIYDESGAVSGLCSIATDVTALNKAQEQLRRLSASIMDNQEKERTAIARELHDELGQVLTALRMDAVWMVDHLKLSDPKAALRALTMCQLIDKNIEDVRNMAIRLRPGVLDDLGLVDALEWYTADFEKRCGITCVFKHDRVPALDDTLATAAYRITQEALTNVARHSKADNVEVALRVQKQALTLTITDDGRGFEDENLSENECLGMAGMRERAALVGGTLQINSRPGKETRIHFTVWLEHSPGKSR